MQIDRRKTSRWFAKYGSRVLLLVLVALFVSALVSSSHSLLTATYLHQAQHSSEALNTTGLDCRKLESRPGSTGCPQFELIQEVGVNDYFIGSKASRYFNKTMVASRATWPDDVETLNAACPIILSGRHERSGLGHAFMSFNVLTAIACFYKLTLNASFPQKLSHSPELAEVAKFFSGDIFRGRYDHAQCQEIFQVSSKTLAATVTKARQTCAPMHPICINITNEVPPSEVLIDVAGYRRNFAVPDSMSTALRELPSFREDHFRISIHMRRGDVVDRTRYASRWISNQAYMDFIPKLVSRLKTNRPISILVFAEGAKSITQIPDVFASTYHDFSVLHKNISLGPRPMHLALATFCQSDILITSPSGYSHLAALLCQKPHILAVPFWHSYAAFPNTLTELSVVRNETGAIVQLDIPASFQYKCVHKNEI